MFSHVALKQAYNACPAKKSCLLESRISVSITVQSTKINESNILYCLSSLAIISRSGPLRPIRMGAAVFLVKKNSSALAGKEEMCDGLLSLDSAFLWLSWQNAYSPASYLLEVLELQQLPCHILHCPLPFPCKTQGHIPTKILPQHPGRCLTLKKKIIIIILEISTE